MAHQEFIDKKYRSLVGLMIICPILFPAVSLAYSDATTHRAVTNETAKVFNHYYPEFSLDADYVAKLIKGSYEEDKAPRWLTISMTLFITRGLRDFAPPRFGLRILMLKLGE